jgi:hypothetical protein
VAPKAENFGLKVHDVLINDWLDNCNPHEWCEIDIVSEHDISANAGGKVQLVFDGMANATPVLIDVNHSAVCAYNRASSDKMETFVANTPAPAAVVDAGATADSDDIAEDLANDADN